MKMKNKQVLTLACLLFVSSSLLTLTNAHIVSSAISILEVTQNGSNIVITLDFNLSIPPDRGETKSLVVLILCPLSSEETNCYNGAMLFFRSPDGDNRLFWMLGDPFSLETTWNSGSNPEHFRIDQNQLLLVFIENMQMSHSSLEIQVFAKYQEVGPISHYSSDFIPILALFQPDLEFQGSYKALRRSHFRKGSRYPAGSLIP